MSKENFYEIKPTMFPLKINPLPSNQVELGLKLAEFDTILSNKDKTNTNSKQTKLSDTITNQSSALNLGYSLLNTSIIQQGSKFLPHHLIASKEFSGKSNNAENIKSSSYINYSMAFQAGFHSEAITNYKKRKKDSQAKIKNENEENDDDSSSKYAHNLNLYHAIDSLNPFKKQDKKNHKLFEKSTLHKMLKSKFMSPLDLLGSEVTKKTKATLSRIASMLPSIKDAPDVYTDNKIDTFEINANYNSLENNRDSKDASWKTWSKEMSSHYLLQRHADLKQYSKLIRQFSGKFLDQERHIDRIQKNLNAPKSTESNMNELLDNMNTLLESTITEIQTTPVSLDNIETIKKIKSQLEDIDELSELLDKKTEPISQSSKTSFENLKSKLMTTLSSTEKNKTTFESYAKNKAIEQSNQWWETIGIHIKQPSLVLPYALMIESAETVFSESRINLDNLSDQNSFYEKLIQDSAHVFNSETKTNHMPSQTVSPEDLMIDNIEYGQQIFDSLRKQKVISDSGKILSVDPNDMFPEYHLTSQSENNRIQKILLRAIQGNTSINTYDTLKINDHERENINLIAPDNTQWDLNTLLTSIPEDKPSKEIYLQARKTYTILFDMLKTMSGSNLKDKGELKPTLIKNKDSVSMSVYPNAEWLEFNPEISVYNEETKEKEIVEGWEKVENSPLAIHFNSEEKANEFFDTIKEAILKLEPLVSTFYTETDSGTISKEAHYEDGEIKESTIQTLIDDQGTIKDNSIITATNSKLTYDTDSLLDKAYFQTNHWKQISAHIKTGIGLTFGREMMTRTQTNRIIRDDHKRKKQKYKEKKEQWEKEQYEKKVAKIKQEAKTKKAQKELLKKIEADKKKRAKELKEAQMKAEAQKKARKIKSKKAQSKKSKKA